MVTWAKFGCFTSVNNLAVVLLLFKLNTPKWYQNVAQINTYLVNSRICKFAYLHIHYLTKLCKFMHKNQKNNLFKHYMYVSFFI